MLKQSLFQNLISAQPNIRFENAEAQTGFTWGKMVVESNILKILGAVSEDGDIDERELHRLGIDENDLVSELWMASDDREHPSLIESPDGRILPLHELLLESGREILGDKHFEVYGPHMGVLMKLIDTDNAPKRGSLSVQVHAPNNHPGRPAKPEMWKGRGKIYIGWNRGMTPEMIRQAVADGKLEEFLNALEIDPSFLINVPGGLVHAIRFGSFLSEWSKTTVQNDAVKGSVKQATVRLYDRTDGKTPRKGKEDLDAALEVVQFSGRMSRFDPANSPDIARRKDAPADCFVSLFATEEIVVDEARIEGTLAASVHHQGYPVYVESGAVDVTCNAAKIDYLERGEYRIVPHVLQDVQFHRVSEGPAVLQRWFPPL